MPAYGPARRPAARVGVSSGPKFRLGLAALIFLMLPVAADAYTLVLRSGRHVTIPDDFRVTPTAVTYEAAPGFFFTVWLSNVDFAATERANAEPEGSFARRIKQEPEAAATPAAAGRRAARKVVTNKELEPFRLRREAQEAEYERTRRERGLPSKQELQERVEEQDRSLREWAERMRAERTEAELESLRTELVNVRGQLNELTLHLSLQTAADGPTYAPADYYPYLYAPPAQLITVLPLGRRGKFGRGNFGLHTHGRRGHHNPRWISPSPPAYVRPRGNAGALPRALPPAVFAPRRSR